MFNLNPMFWSDQAGEPFFEIGQYLAKALQLLKRMESSQQILYIKRYFFTFTLSTLLLCLAKSCLKKIQKWFWNLASPQQC